MVAEAWYKEEILVMLCWITILGGVLIMTDDILARKRCGRCAQRVQCTRSPLEYFAIHMHEPPRQRAGDLANTPAFVNAQRERKKVEALFAELKNQIGLRCLRLRRLKCVREQLCELPHNQPPSLNRP